MIAALGIFFVLGLASLICYGVVCDITAWARHELDDLDVFGDTCREIRALPEVPDAPFGWDLEEAV